MTEAEARDIRIAAAGDAMLCHPLSIYREPRFLRLAEVLRGADASVCNLEMPIHDLDIAHMLAEGSYGTAHPDTASELTLPVTPGFQAVTVPSRPIAARFVLATPPMLENPPAI